MSLFGFSHRVVVYLFLVAICPQVTMANDLLSAARSGDVEALSAALEQNGAVAESDLKHPLFFAAQSGHTDIVAILLERGADPNTSFDFGSALQKAARGNHVEVVALLLKAGAEPSAHAGDKSHTPLHDAAERGALASAELLVEYGADVNARERWGMPPIHLAVKKDKPEMVAFLAASGAAAIEPPSISEAELAAADRELGRITAIGCTQCHMIEEGVAPSGQHNHGPPLMGLVGRAKAGFDGYGYSSAMAALQGVWSVEELNLFIADPAGRVPGTEMEVMPDLTDIERVALIAYLSEL